MNQMRTSQKNRNGRHKSRGNKPSGNILNRVYESAGPEGKVRGTAQQIIDKYLVLARDAQTSGDRVIAENFLQHAEHYIRLVNAAMPPQTDDRRFQGYAGARDESEDGTDEAGDQPAYQTGRNGHAGGQNDDPRDASGHGGAEPARHAPPSGGGALETIDTTEDGDADPVPTPETGKAVSQSPETEPDRPVATQATDAPPADAQAQPAEGEAEAKPKPRRRTRRPKVTDEAPAS